MDLAVSDGVQDTRDGVLAQGVIDDFDRAAAVELDQLDKISKYLLLDIASIEE